MQTACQWRYRIIGGRGAAKMGHHRSGGRGPSLLTDLLTTPWTGRDTGGLRSQSNRADVTVWTAVDGSNPPRNA